jgi:prepilin peptidase CpaA
LGFSWLRFVLVEVALGVIAFALLIYAALHDFAARTIPNWLPVGVLALGCVWRLIDHSLAAGLLVAAATFVVLFAVWMLGAIGGGDAKFWPATALLIPPHWQPELAFFFRVVVIGGLLAVLYLGLWLWLRKRRPAAPGGAPGGAGLVARVLRAEAWRIGRRGPLPYALAISGGAIITLLPFSFQH